VWRWLLIYNGRLRDSGRPFYLDFGLFYLWHLSQFIAIIIIPSAIIRYAIIAKGKQHTQE
jgi:hypothetical protein